MATALLEPVIETTDAGVARERRWENWVNLLTWAAVLVGIAWRVGRYLAQFPIWGDEAHIAVNFLDRDLWGMTKKLDYGQIAPVLFLWIEWGMYHLFGPSELSLRLVPLLAGIIGLLLFRRFCTLTLPPLVAVLAVSMLAVSYFPVRHATEIKPYSFDLMFTLALLLPAVHWVREPERIRWLVLLTALVPCAVAGSYPVVFVGGAISLYLLPGVWRAAWQVRGWYVAFNLAMLGTFLVHILLVGREQLDPHAGTVQSALQEYWKDWFPPPNVTELPLWLVKAHTGAMFAYPEGGPRYGSTATLLLCLAGLWTIWRARRVDLLTLCLVPFALSLLAAFLHRYPYGGSARLAQHLAPAICILASFGIVHLLSWVPRRSWQQNWVLVILLGLNAFGAGALIMTFARPFKNVGDVQIRDMAQELATKTKPGDTIVVFNPHDMPRPSMVWYLRLLHLPMLYQGDPDWTTIDAEQQRLWGVHLRVNDRRKLTSAKLLEPSRASWSVAFHHEYVFAPDSKDVPRQFCDVYLWAKEP